MTSLSISANIPAGVSLFGKELSDLQAGISFGTDSVTGTLHYVEDYTGFSGDPELQEGNYLAMYVNCPDVEGVTYTVTLSNPVELDEDQTIVLRIRDKSTQTITVVASKEGYESVTKTFSLTGLTCEEKGNG